MIRVIYLLLDRFMRALFSIKLNDKHKHYVLDQGSKIISLIYYNQIIETPAVFVSDIIKIKACGSNSLHFRDGNNTTQPFTFLMRKRTSDAHI